MCRLHPVRSRTRDFARTHLHGVPAFGDQNANMFLVLKNSGIMGAASAGSCFRKTASAPSYAAVRPAGYRGLQGSCGSYSFCGCFNFVLTRHYADKEPVQRCGF